MCCRRDTRPRVSADTAGAVSLHKIIGGADTTIMHCELCIHFGIVIVSTISFSVSVRWEMAEMPDCWNFVRVLET